MEVLIIYLQDESLVCFGGGVGGGVSGGLSHEKVGGAHCLA